MYREISGALTRKKFQYMLPYVWSGDFPEGWRTLGILESSLSLSKLYNP